MLNSHVLKGRGALASPDPSTLGRGLCGEISIMFAWDESE